jgi:spore maturation protein SpmB
MGRFKVGILDILSITAALGVVLSVFTYYGTKSKRTTRLVIVCGIICMGYLVVALPYCVYGK